MNGKTASVKGIFSIGALKDRIQHLDGTPARLQQFTCNGVEMADTINLSRVDYWKDSIQLKWKHSE